ncbi:MAG: hypothetical protein LKI24_08390 [Acidipropionibacterium sp.]|nr:hypothetical protein [Acidipropionibacterium sp.]
MKFYLAARSFSWAAGSFMSIALGMWMKSLTGSNTLAGFATGSTLVPRAFGVLFGERLESLPRKYGLIIADLLSAVVLLFLLLVRSPSQFWIIICVGIAYGTLMVVVSSSGSGALKLPCSDEELPMAMSITNEISGVFTILDRFWEASCSPSATGLCW